MTKDQATPRPWAIHAENNALKTECEILDLDGQTMVADCYCLNGLDQKTSAANARLITQAVNAHDELVEALKRARQRVIDLTEMSYKNQTASCETLSIIDCALAKVKN